MRRPIALLNSGIAVFAITGDDEPLEYGGGVVYQTPRGELYWEFWESSELEDSHLHVWRSKIPDQILKEFGFATPSVLASISGLEIQDIVALSKSRDIMERVELIEIIKETHGASSIAQCRRWPVAKLKRRWHELFHKSGKTRYTSSQAQRNLRKKRAIRLARLLV